MKTCWELLGKITRWGTSERKVGEKEREKKRKGETGAETDR